METLMQHARALATALRAGSREYHTFASAFRLSVANAPTVQAWLDTYAEAWDDLKSTAGTPTERKALRAAVQDWEDTSRGNTAFHAWNAAEAANKVLTRMKVYRSTVTKCLARVRDDVGATAEQAWKDVTADEWSTMREHFKVFPNMALALVWGEHGGEPEAPVKPGKGPENSGNGSDDDDDDDKAALPADDAEIVETVRLRYDDTAATAVENVLRNAAERKLRKERDLEVADKALGA